MAAAATARRAIGFLPLLSSPAGVRLPRCRALSLIPPPRSNRLLLLPVRPFSTNPFSVSASSTVSNGAAAGVGTTRELHLYNTKSRRKEQFRPRAPGGEVGMYVCGVTPYDDSHIGHARAYVAFDVLYRYLCYLDYEVRYVRNFTDIDDKIIARANQLGEDPFSLSKRFSDDFLSDMAHLQCLPPSVEPRVSDHIDQIINMIKQILDNKCAYVVGGDVYFSVDNFPEYGELSGRKLDDNRAGERVAVDERKRNPADFALWKAAKDGEPWWDSPWGPGRPGWHIECSAMSAHYLGHSFDIHGGGEDLIFPHHENEIAQSRAACCDSSINYWIHNGFVNVNSQKMSKSLGNFVTIRKTLYDCEGSCQQQQISAGDSLPANTLNCIQKLHDEFETSMSDDLHTSVALAAISEPLRVMNDLLHTRKALQQLREKALIRASITEVQVLQKIEERTAARKAKQYEKSDEIRKELSALGIALMDGPDGTTWRPSVPLSEEGVVAKA
ncbi:hypothetical protein PR202_ga16612 [Eleusine coracana subsp. coracana]|uniref:cysteine--tRNA ligase n=1 Tax=Eleusine coracana subsp. coracana TaxID=191504 RepID=A0AAV5CN67_ELECO|nr:hypothetical protein PR202_ga16612 [Eleusine coracana subsp. coracana]